jgi:sarcosine oxidase, subunit gamma
MSDAFDAPDGAYRLRALPAGPIWLAVSFGEALESRLAALAPRPFALRAAGPLSWLIVGDDPLPFGAAERALSPEGALIDLSHGRVRFEISGPGARHKLSTGTAVDLAPVAFAEGVACDTLFNHIGVHLMRTGADRFEILVGRSFADSLWRELTR